MPLVLQKGDFYTVVAQNFHSFMLVLFFIVVVFAIKIRYFYTYKALPCCTIPLFLYIKWFSHISLHLKPKKSLFDCVLLPPTLPSSWDTTAAFQGPAQECVPGRWMLHKQR